MAKRNNTAIIPRTGCIFQRIPATIMSTKKVIVPKFCIDAQTVFNAFIISSFYSYFWF